MKAFAVLTIFAAAALAQQLGDLASCGQHCVANMQAKWNTEFQCANSTDYTCLCSKDNFFNGVNDCSVESCPANTDISPITSYARNICAGAVSSLASASQISTSFPATSALTASGVLSATPGVANGSASAITTSAIVSTVTSSDTTFQTTVGNSTIFAGAGATGGSSSAITTSAIVSTVTSGSSTFETTLGSTTIFAGAGGTNATASSSSSDLSSTSSSSRASSASSSASRVTSTVTSTSAAAPSSSANAGGASSSSKAGAADPVATFAAHGLAGMVGVAAILVL